MWLLDGFPSRELIPQRTWLQCFYCGLSAAIIVADLNERF
jgi:hypothetical protein